MSTVLSEPPIEELGDEIAELSAGLGVAMCRWLRLVGAFDAREGWATGGGFGSCAHWLTWRCGMDGRTARAHVHVARWLRGVPVVEAAFASGTLSYAKVRALARFGDQPIVDEHGMLAMAEEASAHQLERFVQRTRAVTRREAARSAEDRSASLVPHEDGGWVLRARLTAEDGERLLRALERAEEELFEPGGERCAADVRRADALVHLAGGPGRAGTEVVVHVDADALAAVDHPMPAGRDEPDGGPAGPPAGRCELSSGMPLAGAVARRLGCDAGLVAMVERDGEVLSVGRRTRAIPPALRRALAARQPECAFPGCHRTRWLDAHHLTHWAHGGETKLSNLVLLCRHHHRCLHEGGWSLTRDEAAGRWLARSPEGWTLAPEPPPPDPSRLPAVPPAPPETAEELRAKSAGWPYDLGLCVDAMLGYLASPEPPPEPSDPPEAPDPPDPSDPPEPFDPPDPPLG